MQDVRCDICGMTIGVVMAPTSAQIKKILAGTAFAAMSGMIPPSISEDMVMLLGFRCIPHKDTEQPSDGR